ncbi:hypothetical protein [Phocaeicola vulgatus]|nr:hypothetical protein [Phocaeicola vulgatus]
MAAIRQIKDGEYAPCTWRKILHKVLPSGIFRLAGSAATFAEIIRRGKAA